MTTMTDLLGEPIPEPLPEGVRFKDVEELVGHTIRAVFDSPNGRRNAELVIVTDSLCWLALDTEMDGCCSDDGASIQVCGRYYDAAELADYVSAIQLFQAGCIGAGEYETLNRKQEEAKAAENKARADRLRAQLAQIEGAPE